MTDFEMISRANVEYANTSTIGFLRESQDFESSFSKNLQGARDLLAEQGSIGSNHNLTAGFSGVVKVDEAAFFGMQISAFTENDEAPNARSVRLKVPPLVSGLNPSFCLITNINTAYGMGGKTCFGE